MAIEDVAGGMKPCARPFNLVPPPRDRQFRTATLKAERSKRKADRRFASALDEGEAEAVHAVNTAELARLWGSAGYRDLRAGLPPQEEEMLHRQLVGVLSGETPVVVWHATIASLRAARRAADFAAEVRPRKWRQSYPDLNGW
jgi:hypothetical protein